MATFTRSDELQGAEFVNADLRGSRFVGADLSGVVMRGVDIAGADIDAPWLFAGASFLRVNGVDVIPFVEAELNRRFPGRADRRAGDPDGLGAAWSALERTWTATIERVAEMPAGTVDVSIDGEWSFAQTLRHLVLATDVWLGRAILEIEQPFHAIGLAGAGAPEPVGPRISGDHPLLPACDPRGGVGTPPLRRTRPRRDRGGVRRMNRCRPITALVRRGGPPYVAVRGETRRASAWVCLGRGRDARAGATWSPAVAPACLVRLIIRRAGGTRTHGQQAPCGSRRSRRSLRTAVIQTQTPHPSAGYAAD